MTISSHFVEVQGLRIRYLAAGSQGPVVLLLHGGGTDSASLSWKLALAPLAERRRVIALDWPGYGESDHPDLEYTNDYFVGFLGEFMQALGLARASLAGVSMGGSIALGFALQSPSQVEKLVLVDSYGLQSAAPAHALSYLYVRLPYVGPLTWAWLASSRALARAALQNIFHDPRAVSEDLVDDVYAEIRRPHAGRAFNRWQQSELAWNGLRTNYLARLPEISVPALLVHGAHDRLVPLECAHQAQARLPGAGLHVIANCGHWPQREQPAEFNRVVAQFLAE